MTVEAAALAVGAFVIAAVLTGVIRRIAILHGALDIPNDRSSHRVATPRGGGMAIVIAVLAGLIGSSLLGVISVDHLVALLGGGAAVAIVGHVDDRRGLSVRVRLVVHLTAAVWAVYWLGGLPPIRFGDVTVSLGWAGHVLAVFGIVWTLNLFNFMDGIDGIAASEAVFVAGAGAFIASASGLSPSATMVGLVLAAACVGFLLWNWPPARIFMGDVGSGFVGYVIAVQALIAVQESSAALLVWLILGGVFFLDATLTLARRLARREPVYMAHRTHAYQHLARRWGGHLGVTFAVVAIDLVWLLPSALFAAIRPDLAAWTLVVTLLPIAILAIWLGAGRSETG